MRVFAVVLFYASRVLAVFAVLAGLAAGLLIATYFAAFTCFDTCPSPDDFFSRFVGAMRVVMPCVALEALALVTFVAYCVATSQPRRAIKQTIMFLVSGLVGVAALDAVFQLCQATLPVTEYYMVAEGPAEAWMEGLGLTIIVLACGWTALLARLQWSREAQRTPARLL